MRELVRRGHVGIGSDIATECPDVVDDSGKRIPYEQLDITDAAAVERKLAEMGFELLPDWKDALGRYLREVL